MSLHILTDLQQGSDEWLEARRGIVTASVVGKLLTPTGRVASNDTSRGLTAQLAAERITGVTDPTFMNDDMMRGVLHEPYARDKYAETNGVTVEQVGFMYRDDWGFRVGASPDGLIGEEGGLEVKCPRAKTHIATIIADRMPPQYMAQVQTSLLVSGRDWWDFVSFHAGLPLWTKRVHPDPKWFEAIETATRRFEAAVTSFIGAYTDASEGLPTTEPISNDLGLVF